MDKFKIDSHKLNYHPRRLADWLDGKNIYPVYMELSPIGSCNHRCTFCGLDFMGYKSVRLETERMRTLLPELEKLGVKSIMYAGEGEPFLHRDMAEIADLTKAAGIDVSFTTNGVLMKPELAERVLRSSSWIKISCNGGDAKSHAAIHRCPEGDFDKLFANLRYAVEYKRKNALSCAIGVQLVLLPENIHTVVSLARLCAETGVDYLVIKPFSQHTQSLNRQYHDLHYSALDDVIAEATAYARPDFNVIFRLDTIRKWNEGERPYPKCLALPFWSYIDSSGNVWGCSMFLGHDEFLYGNINENSFEEIWNGEKRKKSLRYVAEKLNISECRINCRMDAANRYLTDLTNPPEHVNFI